MTPARAVGKRIRFAARPHRRGAARRRDARRGWLREAMLRGAADPSLRRLAAAPVDRAARGGPRARARGVQLLDVAEDEIARELAAARSLGEVQARLKCGTECGSCVPELRRLAARSRRRAGGAIVSYSALIKTLACRADAARPRPGGRRPRSSARCSTAACPSSSSARCSSRCG